MGKDTKIDPMTTQKKTMYGLDASNYPTRMGQSWEDDEVQKLLNSIQKKKTIEAIALEHERTVGGIRGQLRRLATDYHFNDGRSIEEIEKYTGLTKEEIEDAIRRKEIRNSTSSRKKQANQVISSDTNTIVIDESIPNLKEMFSILKDIQQKLTVLLDKVS